MLHRQKTGSQTAICPGLFVRSSLLWPHSVQ